MNNFKKTAKYMNIDSFQVIVGFLSQSDNKEDIEMEEESEEGKANNANNAGSNNFFDDLAEVEVKDVEMEDV